MVSVPPAVVGGRGVVGSDNDVVGSGSVVVCPVSVAGVLVVRLAPLVVGAAAGCVAAGVFGCCSPSSAQAAMRKLAATISPPIRVVRIPSAYGHRSRERPRPYPRDRGSLAMPRLLP